MSVLLQRHSNMLAVFVFSVLFLGKWASAFTTADCPSTVAHDKYNQVLGDSCYRFELSVDLEYFNAESYCRRKGGDLVKIESKDVNEFLHDHLKNTYGYSHELWIGLNDAELENDFFWIDGTPLGSYSNWASKDEGPRGGLDHLFEHSAEDCVAIDGEGKWRDYKCTDTWIFKSEHKHFICEFPVVPHPTASSSSRSKSTTIVTATATRASAKPRSASATAAGMKATSTMPPVVSTSTTTAKPETTTMYTCPDQSCGVNCGMDGYATNAKGCMICKCVV